MRCEVADLSRLGPNGKRIAEVATAFGRYPVAVLAAARLERVGLCARVTSGPDEVEGVADDSTRSIFIGMGLRVWEDEPGYAEEATVHHELFHALELGQLRGLWGDDDDWVKPAYNYDAEWELLNPVDFIYPGDRSEPGARIPPGFVDAYSTTSSTEDRAELFGTLMAFPDSACKTARGDEIVRAKLRLLWSRVVAMTGGDEFLRTRAPCIDRLIHTPPRSPSSPRTGRVWQHQIVRTHAACRWDA